jgi:hypothetical protein
MDTKTSIGSALSLKGAVLTLDEQFPAPPKFRKGGTQVGAPMRPLNDPSFSWASGYVWDHNPLGTKEVWPPPKDSYPAWTSNNTADVVPNGDMVARLGDASPYSWYGHSGLCICPKVTPPAIKATVGPRDLPGTYISGAIISYPYAQKYGVFTMFAMLPKGKGLWPAFWLLPYDLSWPPEIDVMEMLGKDPKTLYQTVHTAPKGQHVQDGGYYAPGIEFTDWHAYTVDWGPKDLKFYVDNKLVGTSTMLVDKPCYLLANLALGKSTSWCGAPDPKTTWFDWMRIKYIRAWQRPEYVGK